MTTKTSRHETADVTELRRLAEAAEPFVRPGGTDPATVTLLASDVLALLDRLAHLTEARDNPTADR